MSRDIFYEFARRLANSFRAQTVLYGMRSNSPGNDVEVLLTFVSNITDLCQQHC